MLKFSRSIPLFAVRPIVGVLSIPYKNNIYAILYDSALKY